MLVIVMLTACAPFEGTNYTGGWREVECNMDDAGVAHFTAEDIGTEPRPYSLWFHDARAGWLDARLQQWVTDDPAYGYTETGSTTPDACRMWIAQ